MSTNLFLNGLEMVGTTIDMACWVLHRTAIVMRIGRNVKEINTQVKEIYRKGSQGEEVAWSELGEVTAAASSVIFDGAILYNDARIRQTEREIVNKPNDKKLNDKLQHQKTMQQLAECLSVASNGAQICCSKEDVDLGDFTVASASRLIHIWSSNERKSNKQQIKNIKMFVSCTTAILTLTIECKNSKINFSRNRHTAPVQSIMPVRASNSRGNSLSSAPNRSFYNPNKFVDVGAILEAIFSEETPQELKEFQDPIYHCFFSFPVRAGVAEIVYDRQSLITWIQRNNGRARAPCNEAENVTEETLVPAFDVFGKMQNTCLNILIERANEDKLPHEIQSDFESTVRKLKQGIKFCFNMQVKRLQFARMQGILKSDEYRMHVQKLREDLGLDVSEREKSEKEK